MEHRVDAHHHLWDLTARSMPWIDPVDMATIARRFDVADLAEVTAPARVAHTLVVEAASVVEETEELLALAAREPLLSGVVGFVDLTAADVGAQIDRLRALPGGDRLVGIRSPVQDEPDPNWLLRPDVINGLRVVSARGLVYDLLILPTQIVDSRWEPWASAIAELADHEHVCCKLSGMVTEADWERWTIDDLRPYAAHVIEQFGPDRILFGTDWSVCTLAASYDTVVDVAVQLTASLSDSERAAIFGDNATRVYALTHRES